MVSTWGIFFLYGTWALLGPPDVAAQSSNSSSSYTECSGYVPYINDSVCDELNNNAECGYDGGDCCSCTCVDSPTKLCGYDADFNCTDPNVPDDCGETPSPAAAFGFSNCTGYMWDLGDEICDDDLNNEECGYDGGDCCRCTCRSAGYDYCGFYGYDCLDPDAPTDCESESASSTPSPAAAFGYPDCTGYMYFLQDGYCDWDLNSEECGYDGGDCCRCTCEDGLEYTCGFIGYNCSDPNADTDCPTPSPTPSPAASLSYPNCTGDMSDLQNGYCDSDLNNEECGYDGGDCCSCTCEDGIYYDCGSYGYNCLDPDVDCPTPGPTPTPAAGLGYPDCTGDMSDLQNGYCDSDLNIDECGYDGGDCCRCTCEDGIYYTCGNYGFDCEDPTAPSDCPTPSPTTYPAAALGYPYCTGYMSDLQDGRCDWDLNNEDCGYDSGDCCECSCTGSYGGYECGEEGYDCLDPDPCPSSSAEIWSENTIVMAAIIFIACLCAVCAGCFVIGCMRMKRRATAHTTSLVPPQQSVPNTTTNYSGGQQQTIAHPVGSADPSQVYAGAQRGQQPRAVIPLGRKAPPITRGLTSTRVNSSRCEPIPEGSALERSTNTVAVGHRPNADAIEAERIRLAVAESTRVQTVSEEIIRQEVCRPQSSAYTVITGTEGGSPSDIVNGVDIEEKDLSNADKKVNGRDEGSGSEWGSEGQGGIEERGQQDDDEIGAEDNQQPGTGEVGGDAGRHKAVIGPIGTYKMIPSGVRNVVDADEKVSNNADETDNDQDSCSGSEWGSDGEGGTEKEGPQDDDELGAEFDQLTGTKVGCHADEQEGIILPIGTSQEEGEENDDRTSHGGTQAERSNKEDRHVMENGTTHQVSEMSTVALANFARENGETPDSSKEGEVGLDPSVSAEGKDSEYVA